MKNIFVTAVMAATLVGAAFAAPPAKPATKPAVHSTKKMPATTTHAKTSKSVKAPLKTK